MRLLAAGLEHPETPRIAAELAAVERVVRYPLGEDTFRIDHGDDYFAFFRRMGEVRYAVAFDAADRLLGIVVGVSRTLPIPRAGRSRSIWYLCDLKVFGAGPGISGVSRALAATFRQGLEKGSGYGISMDPPAGPNRVVGLLRRIGFVRAGRLQLFGLDADSAAVWRPRLEERFGKVSGFLSLAGVKDIVVDGSGPMPLLHLQYGPCATHSPSFSRPQSGCVHMFCVEGRDPLAESLRGAGIAPTGEATVVCVGERLTDDWSFVLTSDI